MPTRIVHLPLFSRWRLPIPFSRAIVCSFLLLHFSAQNITTDFNKTPLSTYHNPASYAVGYSESELSYGGDSLLVCPQFSGVGTVDGKLDLNDIRCEETKAARDNILIMTLFGDGSTDQTYQWTRDGEYFWQDGSTGEKADGIYLQPGEAVWVQSNAEEEGIHFKSSGQVTTGDIVLELATDGDSVICGNATPVEIDINDVLCPATKAARDNILIMTLFGDGSTDQTYQWTRDGDYFWQDGSTGEKADGIYLQPGQGVWVQSNAEEEGITITFPGVELTK